MHLVLGPLLIFFLRICDVSIGTLRVMFAVRGMRYYAAALGFVEAGIWILAVRRIFNDLDDYWKIFAYACGFGMGTFVGITLERWIASGTSLLRVISRERSREIAKALRDAGFGLTIVRGEGQEGDVSIIFCIARRRRGPEAISIIRSIDDQAFVTVDPVTPARGGFLPATPAQAIRK